jgi:hypothetical protein
VAGFKKETAQIILETVRYLRESGFVIEQPGRGSQQFRPDEAPIYVRNTSGEEIPPFACMQVEGTIEDGGQNYIEVGKPVDSTGTAGGYLFNGIAPIEVDGSGIAHDGPLVRMLTDGSAINCGDSWQPDVGEWAVIPGGSMFSAIGEDDIEDDVMRAFVLAPGGGGASIEYTIDSLETAGTDSPYNGLIVATATVILAPCDRASLIGEEVEVVDHSGCIFDLPEEDLIGVHGWATEGVALSLASGAGEDDITPCHWSASNRCCVPADSGEE